MPELPEVDPVVSFREYLCQVAGISGPTAVGPHESLLLGRDVLLDTM